MRKAYQETRFGQVHYLAHGRENLPPLVLLHQCPSSSEMYRKLMSYLGRDFYVIAPDLPGFGGTDAFLDHVSVKSISAVIHAFLEGLRFQKIYLFGHHTGASIATELASRSPNLVSSLVLSGPACLSKEEQQRFKSALIRPFKLDSKGEYIQEIWQKILRKAEGLPLEFCHRELQLALVASEVAMEVYEAVFSHNLRDQLQRLRMPVLVTAGRKDIMYPYLNAAFSCLADGKKVVVGDASTYICETHADDLASIVAQFCLSQVLHPVISQSNVTKALPLS